LMVASPLVIKGLQAIHGASVIHRDLKPANILLTEDLTPKISDFGISKLVTEAMTRTSATIGTPIYMAPEAADARGAEAPADVYALGIMLFELLVGQPPFSQGGTFAVLRAHAMDVPPRVEGVPSELTELIAAMLAKDPAARPTVAQVEHRLAALVPVVGDDVSPVAVPPVGSTQVDVDSTEVTGPEAGDRVSSDDVAPAGAIAAAAWLAADSAETVVSPDAGADADGNADGAAAGIAAAAALGSVDSGETAISHDPVVGSEPVLGSQAVPAGNAAPLAGGSPAGDDATIINPGLAASGPAAVAGSAAAAGPGAGPSATFGGLDASFQSAGPNDGVPFVASQASDEARRTGGLGSLFPNRIPRRVIEVAIAFGSLAAVLVVVALVMSSGDDGAGTGIASGSDNEQVAGPAGSAEGGSTDDQGPTEFNSASNLDNGGEDGGDDGADGESTPTTGGPTTSSGVDDSSTTTTDDTSSTTDSSSTSSSSTTSSSTTSSTTTSTTSPTTSSTTTSTTRPTTSSSTTSSSTTTSTTLPTATPIRIVSGPTVNVRNATSFQFNYETNDVCGTGSFRVTNVETGVQAGSFTGAEVCFGPLHGGFPGLAGN
ncbi:MAG: serine/threonine-protein kinase, partial [Actinomycetota bacterium]